MDEKDYFLYSLIFCYVFYYSNYFTNVGGNFLNYYLNELLNFFINFKELDNMTDTIEEIYQENIDERPAIKYEDKFLTNIRKLNKEFIFDEKEKELFEEKRIHFLQTTQNEYTNEIKKIQDRLCEIEIELANLEKIECENIPNYDPDSESTSESTSTTDEKEESILDCEEDEETKEEKIAFLNIEKKSLYEKITNLSYFLDTENGKLELLTKTKEQSHNFIINMRLEKLASCYVMEMTPQGNVLMIYDMKKGSFKYYSDHVIPYRYLEVVCRKYVKLFDCRPLYVDMEEELELAEKRWIQEREEKERLEKEKLEKENKNSVVPEKKNVFAKFKSYNKEGTHGRVNVAVHPKNSIPITKEQEKEKMLLKEKANRFTYEGKLINFSFLKKIDRKVVDKKYGLSFADFKKKYYKTN
jgi:hypothetical protein